MEQSLECSIMDIADDIAYSIHDVDDFYRAGLLSQGAVAREFRGWIEGARAAARPRRRGARRSRTAPPGSALEAPAPQAARSDPWIADDDAFADAVDGVADDLVDGLLASPFDGSIASERALSSFTNRWISHLQASVVPAPRRRRALGPRDARPARLARGRDPEVRAPALHPRPGRHRDVPARAQSRADARREGAHRVGRPTTTTATGCRSASRSSSRSRPTATRSFATTRPEGVPIPEAADVRRFGVAAAWSTTSPRCPTTRRSRSRRRSTGDPTGCGTSDRTSDPCRGALGRSG